MTLSKEGLEAARITQKYIRRYPDSKRTRSWAGRMVHIETENGVWRTNGHGYTYAGQPDAWILPFEQAMQQVDHCGPEKRAAFILAALPAPDGLVERLRLSASVLRNSDMPKFMAEELDEAATVIQTLQRERDDILGDFSTTAHALSAAEQQVRDMRDENARMREALTRIAEMDGTAGTEKGPPCEWTKNGVTTIRPSGIGNFANHIARLALKNQERDRG